MPCAGRGRPADAGAGIRHTARQGTSHRPAPTYLLGVELHEAHHVAIFLESDKEVHHRGEGKHCKHCRESSGQAWEWAGPEAAAGTQIQPMTLCPTASSSHSAGHMNDHPLSRGGTVPAFGSPKLGEAQALPLPSEDSRVMVRHQFPLSGAPSVNRRASEVPLSTVFQPEDLQSNGSRSRVPSQMEETLQGPPCDREAVAHTVLFPRTSHQLTSVVWVVGDLPAGQAIDSHEELTDDQGTHQGHPKGAVKRKTTSGRPDPVLRPDRTW